jgi:hypothetical protein
MNRRQLLKYLAGGVVSVATGEVLVPAARTYFLPPRGGWITSNRRAVINWIEGERGYALPDPTLNEIRDQLLKAIAEMYRLPVRYLTCEIPGGSAADLEVFARHVRWGGECGSVEGKTA